MIGLFNCPITVVCHRTLSVERFCCQIKENRMLNEPIRFGEIIIFVIIKMIIIIVSLIIMVIKIKKILN